MERPILFVQGGSEGAYEADASLAENLGHHLGRNYRVRYPAMPDEANPDYERWKRAILRETREMGDGAILVGHSIGASVLIRSLIEPASRPAPAGVFLIAGPFWHAHDFWRWDEVALPDDAADRFPRDIPLFLYQGDEDEVVPASHLDMYVQALPQAVVRRLPGRDHQLNEDMTEVARDIESLDGL